MINLEKITNKNIFKITIENSIDEDDLHQFTELLAEKAKENQKLKLIVIIDQFPKIENFEAFKELVKMKLKAIQGIEKFAVLTDRKWLEAVVPVANFLTHGIPIKVFELEEEEKAIDWLEIN